MRKPLIPLLAALLAACACNAKIDEAILASPDLGIYQDGTALIRYEPLKYQNAYNESLRQFRIHDDTMSEYFILTLDAIPSPSLRHGAQNASARETSASTTFVMVASQSLPSRS